MANKQITKDELIGKVMELYREQLNALTKEQILGLLNKPTASVKANVDLEVFKPTAEPKTESKTSSKKKSSDDFNRALYLKIGKAAGALKKDGKSVSAPFREFVYAVMDGEMTQSECNRKVALRRKELGWS